MSITDLFFLRFLDKYRVRQPILYWFLVSWIFIGIFFLCYILIPFLILMYLGIILYRKNTLNRIKIYIGNLDKYQKGLFTVIYKLTVIILIIFSIILWFISLPLLIPIFIGYHSEKRKYRPSEKVKENKTLSIDYNDNSDKDVIISGSV